jgi:hypothetical protein
MWDIVYIDKDQCVSRLSILVFFLTEIVAKSDDIKLVEEIEIGVDLLAVFDEGLEVFIGGLIKLLGGEGELQIMKKERKGGLKVLYYNSLIKDYESLKNCLPMLRLSTSCISP